jgi:HSP20 family protein
MAIVRWEPFAELASMRRQMDRVMESLFGREAVPFGEERWIPPIDVTETADEILVKVDMPGVEDKDVSVKLSGDNLIIRGERKSEKEEKDKNYHRVERVYGSFERVVGLPVSVDPAGIKAEYNKGVLAVHMPKKAEVKPKEIPITVK